MADYRGTINSLLAGRNANEYRQAAQASALQNAMAAGLSNPSVSPAVAARQAQQVAAQGGAQAAAQAAQMSMQEQLQGANMAFRQQQADQARMDKFIGAGLDAAGGALAKLTSDERAKTDIKPGGTAIDRLLESVDPATFKYSAGPEVGQERAGVMAQDLAKSDVGRTMLRRDPSTGMAAVDQNAALSALLAATARLNDRLSAIEGGEGK